LRAYQVLAEQSRQSAEVQAKIAIYKARADRKCGEWLAENIKHEGGNPQLSQHCIVGLKELNVSLNESSRLQKIASIPENTFEEILQEAETETKKITNNMLVNIAKEAEKENRKKEFKQPDLPHGKYNIIYADPPWFYPADKAFYGQDVKTHYNVMTNDELINLNLKRYAFDDCVLYLWATAPLLDVAIDIMKKWGFDYKSCLVWDKVKHNMGFYSSVRHEILLIGGIGRSAPTDKSYANQTDSVYSEEKTEHSKKPEYYYEMIEKMHPTKTKRIEFFARLKREGWDSWGDEV
jgi:N6-adenosine-specific RNA methylase IME4